MAQKDRTNKLKLPEALDLTSIPQPNSDEYRTTKLTKVARMVFMHSDSERLIGRTAHEGEQAPEPTLVDP